MFSNAVFLWTLLCVLYADICTANPDAKKLYDDLLSNYNRLIRPVANNSDRLVVKMGMKLSQLIDVNLKSQIMTTNVWVLQEWRDYKLVWDPSEYGGVTTLHVPSENIWLPDIVLYNNADGNYEVTIMTKAILHSDGQVTWRPPAIYKSSCEINVAYFPFDTQTCSMKFGSWTYDGYMVNLKHIEEVLGTNDVDLGIDLREFYLSVEWDIMSVPARRHEKFYSCCETPYLDITFNITLRRKSLFYTVNLIIPCVGISFLSILVFYLPSDSGEKVSLCISILLSLTVFFLLLIEIIPPTSLAVPLLGKYLLFTMILVTLSVIVTIAVLNVNFRSPSTHRMAPWVKCVFIRVLPNILFIQRPPSSNGDDNVEIKNNGAAQKLPYSVISGTGFAGVDVQDNGMNDSKRSSRDYGQFHGRYGGFHEDPYSRDTDFGQQSSHERCYCAEIERAIQNVRFIAQHKRNRDEFEQVEQDWKYVALVLDRLFLWLFAIACFTGTVGIIFSAPSLYDSSLPIDLKLSKFVKHRLMQG